MRLTKEKAAKNRAAIVAAAARLFREKGVDAVSVAEIMSAAGFTHGGFYNHFPSKEALAAEACCSAFASGPVAFLGGKPSGAARQTLARTVGQYLSTEHRDDPGGGCPTAALVTEAARQGSDLQDAYAQGIRDVLEAMARPGDGGKTTKSDRARSMRNLSEMIGALLLSRAVRTDAELSDAILAASRKGLASEDDAR